MNIATTHAPMVYKTADVGPGGHRCFCCGDAPRFRKRAKRAQKRRERQAVRKELSEY